MLIDVSHDLSETSISSPSTWLSNQKAQIRLSPALI